MTAESTRARGAAVDGPRAAMVTAVVFDLGGVLLDWDPGHLLRAHVADGEAVDQLVAAADILGAQQALDLGRPVNEVRADWRSAHPAHRVVLDDYFDRWHDTLRGQFDDVVDILADLRRRADLGLYVLSNFSGDLFREARPRFPFLEWFDGLLISGDEGLVKPDPAVYALLTDRFDLDAPATVFIDDRHENVAAARAAGLVGIAHTSAGELRARLQAVGAL